MWHSQSLGVTSSTWCRMLLSFVVVFLPSSLTLTMDVSCIFQLLREVLEENSIALLEPAKINLNVLDTAKV